VRVIIVESPDRFARDLAVQMAGHDYLKGLGIALVPTSAPDFFAEDTPTAVLVRQVLGAIAQFEKASLVAKMKAARDRKRAETGEKVGGRRSYSEDRPEVVKLAHKLARRRRKGDGSPSGKYRPLSPAMGRFLLTQMASVAELEAGLISERTKAALAAAKALGVRQDDGARRRRLSVLSVAQFVGRRKRPANWDGGGANTTA
jgi:DNA invertase Pin-like site-specific DNA recombinase